LLNFKFNLKKKRLAHSGDKTGFMEKVFGIKVEKATQAHSVLLGDQQVLFELQSLY
jgi:hypothetical protein